MIRRVWDIFIACVAVIGIALMLPENTVWGEGWRVIFGLVNRIIAAIFVADVAVKFLTCDSRKDFLRQHWIELISFLPVAYFLAGMEALPSALIARQATLATMLLSRMRDARRPISQLGLRPAQILAGGFLLVICMGTILLMNTAASASREHTRFLDALFTATSAMCVTGLTVLDTATHFSLFGQIVILGLIQMGGLGIMTAAVALVLILRQSVDVKQQVVLQDALDSDTLAGARQLTLFVVGMTALLELLGAGLMTIAWHDHFADRATLAYHAVFHSISAFCNAGFSTLSDNLMSCRDDISVNIVICLLIVGGGLGFTVIRDLADNLRDRVDRRTHRRTRLRIQTRIVLMVSVVLICGGALLIYAIERHGAFRDFPAQGRILASFFHSVSARTAGFNTCDIGRLSPASLFTLIVLMFIGGSPGSAAGGIKTTTVAVLWAMILGRLKGRDQAQLYRRTIPVETILKAIGILCISLALVLVFAGALMYTESAPPLSILFETVSAFGTVGLSAGITPSLTPVGKLLITLMMLIGRLGPLTMAYALVLRRRPEKCVFAEVRVMIG